MAESSSKFDRPSSPSSSSSSSSGEVSVAVEKDVSDENGSNTGGGEGADVDNRESVGGSVGITDSAGL